jgi:cobyrinic acid a,c-diamide synthase
MDFPRIVMSALRGGSGKTVISIGIIAAWKQRGIPVAPYKKGPDYIDAGWLALAGSRPCYNLDTYLIDSSRIFNSFLTHTHPGDVAVIEGNRGLYDGIDMSGSTSTAELAKLLNAPVILCIDCTKSTRTMAAAVL